MTKRLVDMTPDELRAEYQRVRENYRAAFSALDESRFAEVASERDIIETVALRRRISL